MARSPRPAARSTETDAEQAPAPASEEAPARAAPAPSPEATPSMAQYLEIKAANPDSLLWYRMGDFYELFFEDAVVASAALGIVLTKRGKHLGEDIPMCGVPIHRADEYLQRLIRLGHRVAVCEQLEDPQEARKRGSKAVVRRDVVRLVTPGTLTEDSLLDAKARNYLTALFLHQATSQAKPEIALASLDISTGECEIGTVTLADFPGEIVRLAPGEVIAADAALADPEIRRWIGVAGAAATPVPAPSFDSLAGERALKARLGVGELGGFGLFSRAELAAAGALIRYVELTQIGRQSILRPPRKSGPSTILAIDAASRASLEIVKATSGERSGSLLGAIDRTVTGAGARELASRLASPLRDPALIAARLDCVGYLLERHALREDVRATLKATPDLARALSRLALQRGGPRDLAAVRDALSASRTLAGLFDAGAGELGLPAELAALRARLTSAPQDLAHGLGAALVEEPPHLTRDGGFVRPGYSPELDDARKLKDDSRRVMAALEARYIEDTGIKTLKIRHNNILGYFIEVGQASAKPLTMAPHDQTFRHRQTMANAMRFTTAELAETEARIARASEQALALEQEIFSKLTAAVLAAEQTLASLAGALAEIDHHAALAELAFEQGYVRPLVDESTAFEIRGGRHPVVEQALKRAKAQAFVENDCILGRPAPAPLQPGFDEAEADGRLWIVTGPNMAGKSTFLRQNALIVILAQMGSFVPARSATIGVVDRLFSRVGASDDLASGRSTFMVEMVETAAILNQASERSLVILDEIGRGTATFDGLSIAWACVEHLADVIGCRALFATHYHELTKLADRRRGISNVTISVREWRDEIIFLHKVAPGAADRSYGIQVAKLAGLPAKVIKRAREVLTRLEKAERRSGGAGAALDDLPLFAAAGSEPSPAKGAGSPAAAASLSQHEDGRFARAEQSLGAELGQATPQPAHLPQGPTPLEAALDAITPDDLTPKAALEALYRLKELRRG